jgi:Xaa-Pro aminopeptidase
VANGRRNKGCDPSRYSSFIDPRHAAKKLATSGITNIYAHGHAIGLEPREYPVIMRSDYGKFSDGIMTETTDLPLEEGMTFNLETPYDLPGVGSFQVEKTFLVKKDSAQELFVQKEGVPFILEN